MATETIDVTGLPEPVVNSLRALVGTLRGVSDPAGAALAAVTAAAHPRYTMTADERIAELHRFVAEHGVPGVVIDDRRETFYEGRE